MNLKKSIAQVFSANFLQLITSIIIGFVLPTILSIEGYANLKTYSLYISYIGLFHFGFIDGLYIKYGGKENKSIDKQKLKGEHNFLIVFQLIISIIVLVIGLLLKNIVLILFSMSILPIMIQAFHKYFYQAIGDFKRYSRIIYIYTIIYMILNLALSLVFKEENYIFYCLTMFGANIISILVCECKFLLENRKIKAQIDFEEIIKITKTGFVILVGNLIVVSLFGIDKWFVKLFLTTEDFAYYSFSYSMLNIINVLISAISITFYNYLFSNNNENSINKLKNNLITLGGAASCGFFVIAIIVENFIKKYIPSLNIIAITFAVFPYMILINALYINLYKVNKDEKKYLKIVIGVFLIAILYNIIAIIFFKNTISLAVATVLTLITWVIYSTNDLENVKKDNKQYIYMFLLTITFLICTILLNILIGGVVYGILFIIYTFIFNKEFILDTKKIIIKLINNKK